MKKTKKKIPIPDLTEFTDEEGKKWVQTTTDDLLSLKELNDVIRSVDANPEQDEIVLARIDFQNVNREYYETAIELKKRLEKQTKALKKIITESKKLIDRKNKKLIELIDYIRKIHLFLAHINISDDELSHLEIPIESLIDQGHSKDGSSAQKRESVYEEVEEIDMPLDES